MLSANDLIDILYYYIIISESNSSSLHECGVLHICVFINCVRTQYHTRIARIQCNLQGTQLSYSTRHDTTLTMPIHRRPLSLSLLTTTTDSQHLALNLTVCPFSASSPCSLALLLLLLLKADHHQVPRVVHAILHV